MSNQCNSGTCSCRGPFSGEETLRLFSQIKVKEDLLKGVTLSFGPEGNDIAAVILAFIADFAQEDNDIETQKRFLKTAKRLSEDLSLLLDN